MPRAARSTRTLDGRRMRQLVVVLLVSTTSIACSSISDWATERRLETKRQAALAKIDVAACSAEGGTVKGVCMFGMPACVRPYRDGGKACTDGSQCEGNCIQTEPWVPPGTETTGICETTDEPCGCTSEIVEGRALVGLCED